MPTKPAPTPSISSSASSNSTPAPHPRDSDSDSSSGSTDESAGPDAPDWTQLPVQLDRQLESLDSDAALRPTIITTGAVWSKRSQRSLLAAPRTTSVDSDEQTRLQRSAFDLLDALSRSGALSLDQAELHIVLAATHAFDKSLIDTVIQQNVNPIEKAERSALLLAATVHGQHAATLLRDDQRQRVQLYSPKLFLDAPSQAQIEPAAGAAHAEAH